MTTTANPTIQSTLELSDPNTLADALRKLGLGKQFAVIKAVATGLTAAAAIDITTAAFKAASVITGIDTLETGEELPPASDIVSLRVTASGTAASLGTYGISDAAGTPIIPPGGAGAAMGIATLSDDGKTITFPNTVTAFVIVYKPRPIVPLSTAWATGV